MKNRECFEASFFMKIRIFLHIYPTPDYKDKKIETEKAKTYNTPFLSLKRPDFKYVIFKIVEVSPRNPPAKQHSRFGPIPPNVGRIGCAA